MDGLAIGTERPCPAETDWSAVLSWYEVLLRVLDTPVVRLNRAVAVGELHGPEAGLAELAAVAGIEDYPLAHAARGELLARLGRDDEAAAAYRTALGLPQNAAQRAHLRARLAALVRGNKC